MVSFSEISYHFDTGSEKLINKPHLSATMQLSCAAGTVKVHALHNKNQQGFRLAKTHLVTISVFVFTNDVLDFID